MPHTGPDVAPGSRLTAPGFSEAFWLGSRGSGRHLPLSVVARFGFGRGHVADGLEQPAVVEPVHPLKRGELDCLKGPPRPASVDHLGLVEAVDRLRERIVKTVADAADRGLDARRSQALGVANRDILHPPIAMVHEPATLDRPPRVQGLLERVEHEAGVRRPAHPPADDATGIGIDHEGHVDEARPGRHVGEVRDPEHVRARRLELPVDAIEWARRGLVADRGPHRLAPHGPLQAHGPHQPRHRAARHPDPLPAELSPDLPDAIDAEVRLIHAPDLDHQCCIPPGSRGQPLRISPPGGMGVIRRRGDRQHPADRLDPVDGAMLVDEGDHGLDRRVGSPPPKKPARLAQDLVGLAQLAVLALQRSDAFLLDRGRAGAPALIALGLANPAAQGLRRAADLGRDRADRSRLRGVLALVVEQHPDRTGTDLRRIRGHMLGHGSILPGSGASGKPGAVHPLVVGYAGTGKSTMLGAAREAWEAQGYTVRGAALSGIAAESLEGGSGISSSTLASFEHAWGQGRDQLTGRDVLVIDEAGLVGSRQMERVLSHAAEAGAKVVLVGDPEQLQAIEAGAAFRALADRHGAAEITQVRRQHQAWQRGATKELATERTGAALERYERAGMVHGHATKDEAKAGLVAGWDAARRAE